MVKQLFNFVDAVCCTVTRTPEEIAKMSGIVLPADYPKYKWMEKWYVHTGLLPSRENREEYNQEIIQRYNEKHPDEPVDATMYGEKSRILTSGRRIAYNCRNNII